MRPEIERGFSLIAAIFLLVVLALMGALIASVTGMQQGSAQLDVQGVRAYQAARTGMEWAIYQVVDPGNTLNPTSCGTQSPATPPNMPSCPAASTTLPALGGSLSGFTVKVECTPYPATGNITEGNRQVRVFEIVVTACSPSGSCPHSTSPPPPNGYVERRLQATVSKCTIYDPSAQAPRCSCG
jgi:MSHA biogenesis protein MshP